MGAYEISEDSDYPLWWQEQADGIDKQLLKVGDEMICTYIARQLQDEFQQVIIVTNTTELYRNSRYEVVEDIVKDFGPLGGILSGLVHSISDHAFIIAGDMPNVNLDYIRWLDARCTDKTDIMVAKFEGVHIEPFNGIYSKRCIDTIEEAVCKDTRKIIDIYPKLNVDYISDQEVRRFSPDWKMFKT